MPESAPTTPDRPSPPSFECRVFWSVTPDQTTSPYIRDIVGAIERHGWQVEFLTLRALATSSGQVVHIQWPEHVSRGATTSATVVKNLRSAAIVVALRLRRHIVVLTAHNRVPHGAANRIDHIFRRGVQRLAAATVVLVPAHETQLRADGAIGSRPAVVTIPHPTHPPDTPLELEPASVRRTLVVLGQIHPYHQIQEFIETLDAAANSRPVLVVGGVGDDALLDRLETYARDREWLTVRPGFASDEELVPILTSAAAIVSLQRNTFNSGGPFYALPRRLPIIINEGAQADDLREHVGPDWVYAVPAKIDALDVTDLEDWLDRTRSSPDLSRYEVEVIAQKHIELYELLRSCAPPLQF